MKRQDVLNDYDMLNGRIVSPGKFEGEPIYVPYFWDMTLSGCAPDEEFDEDGNHIYSCHVHAEDHAQFPEELRLVACVYLWEDEQGFVHSQAFTSIPERGE